MKTQTDQTADELSAEQLAEKWGCTLETIWRRCRRGLPHRRIKQQGHKPALRFLWSECERWQDMSGWHGRTEPREGAGDTICEPPELSPSELSGDMLSRVRGQELKAFEEWQEAIAAGKPDMAVHRRHLHWTNLLATIEKARIRSGEARREIEATMLSEVNAHIAEWSKPIRETLAAMPGKLGARANPADPTCATGALTDWVGQLLRLLDRPIFPTTAQGGD